MSILNSFGTRFYYTSEENQLIADFFQDAIERAKVSLWEGGVFSIGAVRTVGFGIYFPKSMDYPGRRARFRRILIHEHVHVLQYQRVGVRYAVGALRDQGRAWRGGDLFDAYRYRLVPGKRFEDYGWEEQAQMMEDFFRWKNLGQIAPFECENYEELGGRDRVMEIVGDYWKRLPEYRR